jgi:aminopeptidase N
VRTTDGPLDLRLFARASLEGELVREAGELFEVTLRGLRYYSGLFGRRYPFTKYDQVFVPEYGYGAMEHPGCVTFNERFLFRARVTDESRRRRAEVLLHEMAHMWFGNLVTMRWWDDLWLNEGFAVAMSPMAQAEATRFSEAWTIFTHDVAPVARRQDQLPTTHPIAAEVPDTDAVRSNFDAITYKKGALVLRQLMTTLGREHFFAGLSRYFDRHAFANADLRDFLEALEEGSGSSLSAWSKEWLETPGVNTLTAEWDGSHDHAAAGTARLQLHQSAPVNFPVLRTHRVQVGLYDDRDGRLQLRRPLDVHVHGPSATVEIGPGERRPDVVIVNDDGLAYVKTRLDPMSEARVLTSLSTLADPVTRSVCWWALWDGVLDAELPARVFRAAVTRHAPAERPIGVLQFLLDRAEESATIFGAPDATSTALDRLCQWARGELAQAGPASDDQLQWARFFATTARGDADLDELDRILEGGGEIEGLAIDRDLRWHVARRLAAAGRLDLVSIEAELARDPSDEGVRQAAAVRSAIPSPAVKASCWQLMVDGTGSLALRRAIMSGFQQPEQYELLDEYVDPYLAALPRVWDQAGEEAGAAFARGLFPRFTSDDDLVFERISKLLTGSPLPSQLVRILREERALLSQAARARDVDAEWTGRVQP